MNILTETQSSLTTSDRREMASGSEQYLRTKVAQSGDEFDEAA